MRWVLAIAIVVTSVVARAETDMVVLGPAVPDGTKPSVIDDAKQAIDKAGVGKRAADIGPSCAADTACVAATGAERAAKRALAVSITDKLVVEIMLVDVGAKELVGTRQVTLKKIGELATALPKLVDEVLVDRAKAYFATGNQHYALGEMAPALEAYKRAYQMKPLAEFLFNIAQCHRKLGQHREAITMYQSYLVGVPDAQNRALVEELIAEAQNSIAEGDRREAQRLAEMRRAREAEARAEAARTARKKRSILPWVAVGVGAAAILGGGILYVTSETDDGSQPTYRDTRPAGIGVAIGGGVVAATGALFMFVF